MDTREIYQFSEMSNKAPLFGLSSWKEHIIAIPKEKKEHRFTNKVFKI